MNKKSTSSTSTPSIKTSRRAHRRRGEEMQEVAAFTTTARKQAN